MAVSPGRPNTTRQKDRGNYDPTAEFPRIEYINDTSTNKSARGHKVNKVYVSGGDKGVDLGLQPLTGSQYPKNNVTETEGGHVLEFDDTPGNERVVILHSSKAGIEIRPDGTVIISSGAEGNKIEIVGNDHRMIVERNGDVHYKGNLNFKVDGDMNLEVGGSLTTKIVGDEKVSIGGNYEQIVANNYTTEIKKNKAQYVLGVNTDVTLSDKESHVKGNENKFVQGDVVNSIGGSLTLTSKDEMIISTSNANIAATNMTLIGTTGTIGGESIIHYGKNYYGTSATFTAGVTAPTFHGSLKGTAEDAQQATTAGALGPVSIGSLTNTSTDVTATVEPTSTIMTDYLDNSNFGIRNVNIDPGDIIANSIDFNGRFGNVTASLLDSAEVRSKLRNDNNLNNSKFLGGMVGDRLLGEQSARGTPTKIGRIVKKKQTSLGEKSIGQTPNPLVRGFKEL